jgi:acetyl esterase/lipase
MVATGSGLLLLPRCFAETSAPAPETQTYKMVSGLAIKADVFQRRDGRLKPAIVWIHGGALMMGDRTSIDRRVKQFALDAGYVLISIDYRLAPETKLPEIIQDVEDAFAWIGCQGAKLFELDPTKIAVIGGSAGGYLSLASGFRVRPRPTVLMSIYGYGDLIGEWYSKPSPHPRHNLRLVRRDEAFSQVAGAPISDSRDRKGDGGLFYLYCRQTGTWPTAVTGWDPVKDAKKFDPLMPIKNVTVDYPPTVLIHGTADTDVPYEQSAILAQEFERHNVPHRLITVDGAEHGLGGVERALVDDAYDKAFAFVDARLRK